MYACNSFIWYARNVGEKISAWTSLCEIGRMPKCWIKYASSAASRAKHPAAI